MSLRQEILKEIKSMLNEVGGIYYGGAWGNKAPPSKPAPAPVKPAPAPAPAKPDTAPAQPQSVKKKSTGASREQIKKMQEALNSWLGSPDNNLQVKNLRPTKYQDTSRGPGVDGRYGPDTQNAVKLFRSKYKNIPRGIGVVRLTAEINKILNQMSAKKNTETKPSQSAPVKPAPAPDPAPLPNDGTPTGETKENLDRYRERTAASLFERLVKDTTKKRVI